MDKIQLLFQYFTIPVIISLVGGGGYFGFLGRKRKQLVERKEKLKLILGKIEPMNWLIQSGNYHNYNDPGRYSTNYSLTDTMKENVLELTGLVGSIENLSMENIDAYNCVEVLAKLKRDVEDEITLVDKKIKSKNPF